MSSIKMNEFSDISNGSSGENLITFKDETKGCYVTRGKGVFLFVLAVCACVIVGVCVWKLHPDLDDDDDDSGSQEHSGLDDDDTSTTPMMMTTQSPAPESVRLPTHLRPYHYNVHLKPDIYQESPEDFKFTGSVQIFLTVESSTDEIIVHIKDLVIDKSSITVSYISSGDTIGVKRADIVEEATPLEWMIIPTSANLAAGEDIQVYIEFEGPIRKDLHGIYYSDYVNEDGVTVYLLTSQLQSTDARKVFPCLDEPALKATFNVSVDKKTSHTTKSNTEILRIVAGEDDWETDVYETSPIMSTYLLGFLISDFRCQTRYTAGGILVEVCARPTAYDQLDFANSVAVELQDFFAYYHNISYPLSKMTHVAVPDFAYGAMENWGICIYRETALLYDAMTSPTSRKQRVAVVLSHELAHMWFGDLVTPEWWDDIWLNEGFASYMENFGIDNIHDYDQWEMDEQFVVHSMQSVMLEDSLTTSHPVYQEVGGPAEISSIFDRIAYDKGSSVIRMMKYFLGEETFRWGLSKYLKANAYGVTDHADLFSFLTQQSSLDDNSSRDVGGIMNTWIRQMGYPVINVAIDRTERVLTLTQKRFLLDPNQNVTTSSPYDYIWKVPISYTTDTNPPIDLEQLNIEWLTDESDDFSIADSIASFTDDSWVLLNVGQTFYYRVNYDEQNWNNLIAQLQSNHMLFNAVTRSQIIDDLFNLARAGEIAQVTTMRATQYMTDERSYAPWYALIRNVAYMRRMLLKSSGSVLLQTYMQSLLNDVFLEVGYEDRSNDTHLESLLRARILNLACFYQTDLCLIAAYQAYGDWMSNTSTEISGSFAQTVYCHGIAEGGLAEWEFAHNKFLESNSAAEKDSLMRAMACSKQNWILQRYLEWALAENDEYGIGRADMYRVLSSVANNPIGAHIAWNFFKANWAVFYERFGDVAFTMSSMVSSMTLSFSTEWELNDIQYFMQQNPDLGAAEREFEKSMESIVANIRWRSANEEELVAWLASVTA